MIHGYDLKWLLTPLLLPSFLLVIAVIFWVKQPKKINPWYGYRTGASMRYQDTWVVANKIASKALLSTSAAVLSFTLLALLLLGKSGIVFLFGSLQCFYLIVTTASAALVLLPIVITEYKLSRLFDVDGCRK